MNDILNRLEAIDDATTDVDQVLARYTYLRLGTVVAEHFAHAGVSRR